jgi:hypothetical protein
MDIRPSSYRAASRTPAPRRAEKGEPARAKKQRGKALASTEKKGNRYKAQEVKAMVPTVGGPVLSPPLHLNPGPLIAPMDVSSHWNQAKDWVIGTVNAASDSLSPGPNEDTTPSEAQKAKEDKALLGDEARPKAIASGRFKKGLRSFEIPLEYVMGGKVRLTSQEVYSKYHLARRFILQERLPKYFTGRHSYTSDEIAKAEEEAVAYYANQIGELRPIVDDALKDAIDVPSLIRKMTEIAAPAERTRTDQYVRSFTAPLNGIKTFGYSGVMHGVSPAGAIQSVYHEGRVLHWPVLQRAVMDVVLNAPPKQALSFQGLDQNLRRALGIHDLESPVVVTLKHLTGKRHKSTWQTSYQKLFEHAVKQNASYVLDYALLTQDAMDAIKISDTKLPRFRKVPPKDIALEELS